MDIRPIQTSQINWEIGEKVSSTKPFENVSGSASSIDVHASQKIHSIMKESPEIRADKVEEARALIADPNFPSDEIINEISELLVTNLSNEKS